MGILGITKVSELDGLFKDNEWLGKKDLLVRVVGVSEWLVVREVRATTKGEFWLIVTLDDMNDCVISIDKIVAIKKKGKIRKARKVN